MPIGQQNLRGSPHRRGHQANRRQCWYFRSQFRLDSHHGWLPKLPPQRNVKVGVDKSNRRSKLIRRLLHSQRKWEDSKNVSAAEKKLSGLLPPLILLQQRTRIHLICSSNEMCEIRFLCKNIHIALHIWWKCIFEDLIQKTRIFVSYYRYSQGPVQYIRSGDLHKIDER